VKLKEDLLNKKKRLTKAEREYKELCRVIEDLTKNDKMLKNSEDKYESFLKEKAKAKSKLEKDIKIRKKEYFKVRSIRK
jgi:CHASE3 domain sensor protein